MYLNTLSQFTFNKMAYHRDVWSYIDETVPGKWIGRRGMVEYPPGSPDLITLDFSYEGPWRMWYIV
jgi:hypothetical protein